LPEAPVRTSGAEPADGLPHPARRYALITLCLAVAMSVLDGAIANIALPTIAIDLNTSPAASIWVVNAYQLAITVSLLPFSSLGDIYGYRRVFLGGLGVFTAASLGCSLSHTLLALVLSRVVQGFGAAGIMSVNTALVRFVVPRAQLGRGMARITLTVAASAATGPTVAAGILSVAPWPYLFAVNIPIGIVAVLLALRSLPRTPLSPHGFDLPSALLNAATFGLLIIAVDGLGQGETPLAAMLQLAGAGVVGVFFIRRQLSLPAPMLPVDLFQRPIFALSVATSICSYTAQTLAYVALPFMFQYAGGLSQIETGLLMTPWPFIVVFVAPLAGRLSDRYSAGLLGGLGLAVLTFGLLLLFFLPADASNANIAWRMAVCGTGFGFFQTPNNRAILSSAPRERSGASSGMLATARLLGQTGGAALVALIFGLTGADPGGVGYGASVALAVGAGFSAAGAIASAARLRTSPR
jgi:DHA2 family multidrug resistance protein-like MFS transporter